MPRTLSHHHLPTSSAGGARLPRARRLSGVARRIAHRIRARRPVRPRASSIYVSARRARLVCCSKYNFAKMRSSYAQMSAARPKKWGTPGGRKRSDEARPQELQSAGARVDQHRRSSRRRRALLNLKRARVHGASAGIQSGSACRVPPPLGIIVAKKRQICINISKEETDTASGKRAEGRAGGVAPRRRPRQYRRGDIVVPSAGEKKRRASRLEGVSARRAAYRAGRASTARVIILQRAGS